MIMISKPEMRLKKLFLNILSFFVTEKGLIQQMGLLPLFMLGEVP